MPEICLELPFFELCCIKVTKRWVPPVTGTGVAEGIPSPFLDTTTTNCEKF